MQVGTGGAVVALQICRFWARTSESIGPAGNITAFSGRNLKKRCLFNFVADFFSVGLDLPEVKIQRIQICFGMQ